MVWLLFFAILLLGGIIIAVLVINWRLTLLTMMVLPLIIYVVSKAGKKNPGIRPPGTGKIADLTSVLEETFTRIRVVKAFTMGKT